MKKYVVCVESIMKDFVEVTANYESEAEAKKIAEYEMSKIYQYVEYDSDEINWCYGETKYKATAEENIMIVVSTLTDYVEVYANNEEEAKKISIRAMSDIYSYAVYESEVISWQYGETKYNATVVED